MPCLRSSLQHLLWGAASHACMCPWPGIAVLPAPPPQAAKAYRFIRRQAVACSSSNSRRKRASSTSAYSGWRAAAAAPLEDGWSGPTGPYAARCRGGAARLVAAPAVALAVPAVAAPGGARWHVSAVGVSGLGSPSASMRNGLRARAAAGLHSKRGGVVAVGNAPHKGSHNMHVRPYLPSKLLACRIGHHTCLPWVQRT